MIACNSFLIIWTLYLYISSKFFQQLIAATD